MPACSAKQPPSRTPWRAIGRKVLYNWSMEMDGRTGKHQEFGWLFGRPTGDYLGWIGWLLLAYFWLLFDTARPSGVTGSYHNIGLLTDRIVGSIVCGVAIISGMIQSSLARLALSRQKPAL